MRNCLLLSYYNKFIQYKLIKNTSLIFNMKYNKISMDSTLTKEEQIEKSYRDKGRHKEW